MSVLNKLTEKNKQYFRSIALLNPEGDAVYVGTGPEYNNLNHFGGYYLSENNIRCGAGLKLMGNLNKDYYMDKTEWETLFGPFIYEIDKMSIEQQFKLAKSFIGTESNGGGKIISVEILSEFSPLRSQSTVKALAKNKNDIRMKELSEEELNKYKLWKESSRKLGWIYCMDYVWIVAQK